MGDSTASSKLHTAVGWALLALGIAVFTVRLLHEGPYGVPRGGNLFGGLGALVLGGLLVWGPRWAGWLALVASPVVLFLALYATMAELEEVVVLRATDSAGRSSPLRLWIVDRDDGMWVGMPRSKATAHALDGARLELLRGGQLRCVVPALHEDRSTVGAIHALKVGKYAVARAASAIGVYPRTAPETSVALRLDPCPAEPAR